MPNLTKEDLKYRFDWMTNNPTWQVEYAIIMSMADSLEAKDALIVSLRAELAARNHDPLDDAEIEMLNEEVQDLRRKAAEVDANTPPEMSDEALTFRDMENERSGNCQKELEYLRAILQRMSQGISLDAHNREVEAKFNEKISNYQKALDMTRQDEKVWRDRFDELMITFNSLKQSENNLATQLVQLRARHDDMKAAVRAAMED